MIAVDITQFILREAFAALVRFRVWNSEARFEALALMDGSTGSVAERLAFGYEFLRPVHQRARVLLEHGCLLVTRYR